MSAAVLALEKPSSKVKDPSLKAPIFWVLDLFVCVKAVTNRSERITKIRFKIRTNIARHQHVIQGCRRFLVNVGNDKMVKQPCPDH